MGGIQSSSCNFNLVEYTIKRRLFCIFDKDKPYNIIFTYTTGPGLYKYWSESKRFSSLSEADDFINEDNCFLCGKSKKCLHPGSKRIMKPFSSNAIN